MIRIACRTRNSVLKAVDTKADSEVTGLKTPQRLHLPLRARNHPTRAPRAPAFVPAGLTRAAAVTVLAALLCGAGVVGGDMFRGAPLWAVTPQGAPSGPQPGGKHSTDTLRRRTLEQIQQALAEINKPAAKEQDALTAERLAALRRLKSYRYLIGLPYENLVLDDDLNQGATAAARICEKIGRLDHAPPNPDWPEAEYQAARMAAAKSNLFSSTRPGPSLATSVDAYMNDSDKNNIVNVGHRRWCLNPALRKVGFGRSGNYAAMWTFDRSQPAVPAFDYVAYPPPGLMPLEYFGPEHAWSVSLNPAKYGAPDAKVEVSIFPADASGAKTGAQLTLNHTGVSTRKMGIPNCIIFRPERSAIAAGKTYLVEIKGVRHAGGKKSAVLRYPVTFVRVANGSSPQDDVPPVRKSFASVHNRTDGPLRFIVNKGKPPVEIKTTLHITARLPTAGLTVFLLPSDSTGKSTPILLRNGDEYTVTRDGKKYKVEKLPRVAPPANKPAPQTGQAMQGTGPLRGLISGDWTATLVRSTPWSNVFRRLRPPSERSGAI